MLRYATLAIRFGTLVSFAFTGPALLKDILRREDGWGFEVQISDLLSVGRGRACFDVVKSQLRSSKFSPQEQGSIWSLFCNGARAADRAAGFGCIIKG